MRRYSEEERRFLRENIPGRSYAEAAAAFNAKFPSAPITPAQINSFCGNNKVSTGRDGRFRKGLTLYNKGMKGIHLSPATEFKKGHSPHNHRPVGSTRVTVDGYTEIKIAEPKKWRMLHVIIYEKIHGPIPKGHVVIFGDGDRQNITPENLILVSRAQLVRLNQQKLIGASAELTKTGVLVADLIIKISEKKKAKGAGK